MLGWRVEKCSGKAGHPGERVVHGLRFPTMGEDCAKLEFW